MIGKGLPMTPEQGLLAALHNIIQTTLGTNMRTVGDYLNTESETIDRFAWLPKRMSNDKLVWLKKYIEVRHHVQWRHMPRLVQGYVANRFTAQEYLIYTLQQRQGIYTDITEK